MSRLSTYIFFVIICLIGCQEDSSDMMDQIDYQFPFCIETSPSAGISPIDLNGDFGQTCDDQTGVDQAEWCEIVPAETLLLGENAKCWMPQYQFEIGKSFTYNDANGQSKNLTLTDKDHLIVKRIYNSESCDEEAEKRSGLCYDSELIYIVLKDSENEIEYYIEMRNRMIRFAEDKLIATPELFIVAVLSNNDARGALLWDREFDATRELFNLTDFNGRKVLLNQEFFNVSSLLSHTEYV